MKIIKNFIVNKATSLVCSILQKEETKQSLLPIFHKVLNDNTTHKLVPQIFHKVILDEISQQVIAKIIGRESIQKSLWKSVNIRPDFDDMFYAYVPNSVRSELFLLATKTSAEYVSKAMSHLGGVSNPIDLLNFCISQTSIKGLFLEFGVFSGYTINHIASKTQQTVHGFDSFEGIPEDWNAAKKGTFNRNGKLPEVADNVTLHAGWFNKTIPLFKEEYTDNISFLHIDCDLYSSTKEVLFTLKDQIVTGTIIVFDEYYNYPGWEKHEFLAFKEFIKETGKKYEYIAFSDKGFSVGVKIV